MQHAVAVWGCEAAAVPRHGTQQRRGSWPQGTDKSKTAGDVIITGRPNRLLRGNIFADRKRKGSLTTGLSR